MSFNIFEFLDPQNIMQNMANFSLPQPPQLPFLPPFPKLGEVLPDSSLPLTNIPQSGMPSTPEARNIGTGLKTQLTQAEIDAMRQKVFVSDIGEFYGFPSNEVEPPPESAKPQTPATTLSSSFNVRNIPAVDVTHTDKRPSVFGSSFTENAENAGAFIKVTRPSVF